MYFRCGENLATIRNMSKFTGYTTLSNTINDCFLVEEEFLSHSHNKTYCGCGLVMNTFGGVFGRVVDLSNWRSGV